MGETAPFSAIEIEINHECNRRCSYCPNSTVARKSQSVMSDQIFDKLLSELADLNFYGRLSYHFYNEPMLHPDFIGIVSRTRASLPKVSIQVYTNGTLLTRPRFDHLLAAGVSSFIVTRHENEVRHVFSEVYQGLNDELKQRVRYLNHEDLVLTNRGGSLKHLNPQKLPLAPCQIPSQIVTVTVTGKVLPCFEDFHETQTMGNIVDHTLMEIWNSEKYRHFRTDLRRGLRHKHSPCSSCNRGPSRFEDVVSCTT